MTTKMPIGNLLPTKVPPLCFLSRIPPLAYVSSMHQCTDEPIHALSHTLSITYTSPSHPHVADFNSVLPRTRTRNRTRQGACAGRSTAAAIAHTIGETPLPSGPAPANSRPSPANFPSCHRRRLSGNRLLLAI
jgi:hypothetical protein